MMLLKESIEDTAKKYFGIVPNYEWELGFWINTDGTILDGSGRKFGNDGYYRAIDHRDIAQIDEQGKDGYDAMLDYEKRGNIRFIPEAQGFEILKEPTSAQYSTIRNISKYFEGNSGVDFIDEHGNNIGNIEYEDTKPYKIINDIEKFFETGYLSQGD